MAKYKKTRHLNIYTYETKRGTFYRIRKTVSINGVKDIIDESSFKTLAAAKARLREIEESIDKSETGYLRSQKLTVSEYYKEYSNRKTLQHAWSKDTRYGNDSLFRTHILPAFGNTPLIKLQRPAYELFINDKLNQLRRNSVTSIHIAFMAMINDAVYTGVIERNRLMRIHIGESKVRPKNKRISLKDYATWMKTAETILSPYEFAIVYLCAFGLRRGEVCGLRKAVVSYEGDSKYATLHIVDTRTSATAKEGKGGTKTKSSERYVALDSKGTWAIETIIQEAQEIKKDFGEILHQYDFLLLNPTTCLPYHPTQVNRFFSLVSDSCSIKISPHMLRHFFATQAAIAGAPKEHVAAYLGHSEKVMTAHYTHIANETAAGVIDIVSKRISGNDM